MNNNSNVPQSTSWHNVPSSSLITTRETSILSQTLIFSSNSCHLQFGAPVWFLELQNKTPASGKQYIKHKPILPSIQLRLNAISLHQTLCSRMMHYSGHFRRFSLAVSLSSLGFHLGCGKTSACDRVLIVYTR